MSYFLVLSHFFLLHLFIELNFTVSFNFQVTQSLLSYFLLFLIAFNFFESVFIYWCCPISYFLLAYFLLSHLIFFFLIAFIYWTCFTASFNHTLLGLFLIFTALCFQTHCFQMCHTVVTECDHICQMCHAFVTECDPI